MIPSSPDYNYTQQEINELDAEAPENFYEELSEEPERYFIIN
jgi:hypothetical protein